MKIWLDILTPKQANMFTELNLRLHMKGARTLLTTRQYREVNELLELKGVKAVSVGRHGGVKLEEKLVQSAKRSQGLSMLISEEKPDIAISFSSPEAARVAFGLGIPHYCISDSPHAEAVSKLTIPLSQKLFTPWVIPLYAWNKYGISPRDIIRYRGLDPASWLDNYKPNRRALDSLKLDPHKPIIVIRTPEEFASYLSGLPTSGSAPEIIGKILEIQGNQGQIVVLPRYETQSERIARQFGSRITVCEHIVDAVALLSVSSVFVGGGGTMTAEAALLGIPVISYYPGNTTFIERFLINCGLVERFHDAGRVAQRAITISQSAEFQEFYRKRSMKLRKSMEDPLNIIVKRIFKR
jgi:predicted glycosyltransferase